MQGPAVAPPAFKTAVLARAHDSDRVIRKAAQLCKEQLGWMEEDQTQAEQRQQIRRSLAALSHKDKIIEW